MRNYDGYRVGDREFIGKRKAGCNASGSVSCHEKKDAPSRENKKLVVEENTIYEIDLDCMDCLEKKKCP